ncbi:trypsin epsilon-like [Cydia fagiglandana]|uniref:trypsin epsilon-like n=1 Tax=Cydia fagiglandana TaxID=1458189 RepID=UPI002FEDEE80
MAAGLFVLIYSFKCVMGKREGFIVGGDYVRNLTYFPWAGFLLFNGYDESYGCGSSILNQDILITAANCFTFNDFFEITATVGHKDKYQGYVYRVEAYKLHSEWDIFTMSHDIALCKLKKKLYLRHYVKRLILMVRPPKEKTAELVGWGAIEEIRFKDTKLIKTVYQKLWTREKCKEVLYELPEGTICGGEENGSDFPSSGDTGSGLVIRRLIIVGVYSYKDIRVSRSLGVYTNVSYFYDWIKRSSRQLKCD